MEGGREQGREGGCERREKKYRYGMHFHFDNVFFQLLFIIEVNRERGRERRGEKGCGRREQGKGE